MSSLLFIGSFPTESQGGTSTASLLLKKALEDVGVQVLTVDSTIRNVTNNSLLDRIKRGLIRRQKLRKFIALHQPSHALIFCGHGLSLIEKGYWLRKFSERKIKTILAPRSGLILKSMRFPGFERILRSTIRKADMVLCQGQYWFDFYQQFDISNQDKFKVLPNWVESEQFRGIDTVNQDSIFRIMVVGWLNEDKGVEEVLEISKDLTSKSNERFEIHVYGQGPLEIAFKERIKGLPVVFHSWVTQETLWRAMQSSSILLFLSKYEGMPNAVMEALCAGLPVLGYNISTLPELVVNGRSGFLFELGQTNQITAKVIELMENPVLLQTLSKNALEDAQNFPTPTEAANKILSYM